MLGNEDTLYIKPEQAAWGEAPHAWARGRRRCSGRRCQAAGDRAGGRPYRDALGLQDEAGHVPGGQAGADGVLHAPHQAWLEGVPGSHLQEEDHPLFPVLAVLGDAEAVRHLLKGFHCRDRGGSSSRCPASASPTRRMDGKARPPGLRRGGQSLLPALPGRALGRGTRAGDHPPRGRRSFSMS